MTLALAGSLGTRKTVRRELSLLRFINSAFTSTSTQLLSLTF
jgi:hypothetical protein